MRNFTQRSADTHPRSLKAGGRHGQAHELCDDLLWWDENGSDAPPGLIYGLDGNDTIEGDAGHDYIDGGDGDDVLNAEEFIASSTPSCQDGNDRVFGRGGDDELYGGKGEDRLDGGIGRDSLQGDIGNDTLIVDGAFADGLDELDGGAGHDLVRRDCTASASSCIRRPSRKTPATTGWRSARRSTFRGSWASKRRPCSAPAISICPATPATTCFTETAGANGVLRRRGPRRDLRRGRQRWLDGQAGEDRVYGGPGDDIVEVDRAGDQVVESAGEGIDRIQSYVSWTLGANIENLVLYGSTDLFGNGNGLANVINGQLGANVLSGLGGADQPARLRGERQPLRRRRRRSLWPAEPARTC